MSKKSPKISQLEHLKLQKARLETEADTHLAALDKHWEYMQNNLGSLMLETSLHAVSSKLPPGISSALSFFIGKREEKKQLSAHTESSGIASAANGIFDIALEVVPLFFKGRKPVFIAFILKNLKNLFLK